MARIMRFSPSVDSCQTPAPRIIPKCGKSPSRTNISKFPQSRHLEVDNTTDNGAPLGGGWSESGRKRAKPLATPKNCALLAARLVVIC